MTAVLSHETGGGNDRGRQSFPIPDSRENIEVKGQREREREREREFLFNLWSVREAP